VGEVYHRNYDILDRLTEKVYTALNSINPYREVQWGAPPPLSWFVPPQERVHLEEQEGEEGGHLSWQPRPLQGALSWQSQLLQEGEGHLSWQSRPLQEGDGHLSWQPPVQQRGEEYMSWKLEAPQEAAPVHQEQDRTGQDYEYEYYTR
jgi:hypothetical protein